MKSEKGQGGHARAGPVFIAGTVISLVAIAEALVLIFHSHPCPKGWTSFDLDAPIGTASLMIITPLLVVAVTSSLIAAGVVQGRSAVRRFASSLVAALIVAGVALVIALVLGAGVLSNLGSSPSGCLIF